MSERIRLVRGACPFPNEIVSLSIRMKTTPTKTVASSERIAPGLICSTSIDQLAEPARGGREKSAGRPPKKMAEHDSHHDRNHEGQAGKGMHGFPEVVGNRLIAGKEGPGFEDKEEEDRADDGGD